MIDIKKHKLIFEKYLTLQKNNLIFIFIISIFLFSCVRKIENLSTLSKEEKNEWISDSTGCLKVRLKFIQKHIINYKSFINIDISDVEDQLGNCNTHYKYGKFDYYIYFITCKYAPIDKSSYKIGTNDNFIISQEVTTLNFAVLNKKVVSATVMMP